MKKLVIGLSVLLVLVCVGAGAYLLRPQPQAASVMTVDVKGEIVDVKDGVMTVKTESGEEYRLVFAEGVKTEEEVGAEDKIAVTCTCAPDAAQPFPVTAVNSHVKPKLIEVKGLHGLVTAVEGSIVTLKEDTVLNREVKLDVSRVSNLPSGLAAEDELNVDAQYWDNHPDVPWEAVSVVRIEKPAPPDPTDPVVVDDEKPNPNALKDGDVTPKGFQVRVINGITYIDGVLIANKTYRLPMTYNPGGLTKECRKAFEEMKAGAAEDGYTLKIVSGFRSFETQYVIYWRYVRNDGQKAADTYSARPGHSEHQTGLAMDLNSLKSAFGDTPEGKWLAAHCHEYGFIIRYPKGKSGITGYIYEPWHVRYVGVELATKLYESGLTLEEYFGIDSAYYEE